MPFPQKIYAMLSYEDPSIVAWTDEGEGFTIKDTERFVASVIPFYFRHGRMTSFQRQLNLYGFKRYACGESDAKSKMERGKRKKSNGGWTWVGQSAENAGSNDDGLTFRHLMFRRDEPDMCKSIVHAKLQSPVKSG